MPDSYPGLVSDLLIVPLIVYSVLSWKKSPKNDLMEKVLISFWSCFVIYFILVLVSAEKYHSKITSILNIREIYPFILFYFTPVIINSKEKLIKVLKFVLVLSAIASLFAVAQSIYGPKPMFDPTGFYNTGHWAGQGTVMIGPISRVALPTMYLIYFVSIALVIYDLVKGKLNFLPLIILLTISILISFTRSFWLATTIAVIFTVIILIRNLLINKNTFYISFISLIVIAGLILLLIMLDNPISISINDRLLSIFSDIHDTSGTYSLRLISLQKFIEIWRSFGVFFGIDPFFIGRFNEPTLSDVGFVYVLVTIGLVGLILLISIWILGISYAIKTLKTGVKTNKVELSITGAFLFASIIFFIICQVYTQFSFSSSLFALIFGTSIASKRIFDV
jgi:hypothetical protein